MYVFGIEKDPCLIIMRKSTGKDVKRMNVFLLTDLEGIPGIDSIDYMDRQGEPYQSARKMLTDWINRTARFCKDAGADTVYYLDGHGGGGNVFEERIDHFLVKADTSAWETLLAAGKIDCQIELGAHARAGSLGGFLDHTVNSKKWFCYSVNGREFSELAMHAALCGKYNVPVVACIGDECACQQAKEYIPDIVTASVKKASCRNNCICYENAEEVIRECVKKALATYREIPPFRVKEPAEIELTFYRTDFCEEAMEKASSLFTRKDARTLIKTVSEIKNSSDLKF